MYQPDPRRTSIYHRMYHPQGGRHTGRSAIICDYDYAFRFSARHADLVKKGEDLVSGGGQFIVIHAGRCMVWMAL
jgi:hypothetical protein